MLFRSLVVSLLVLLAACTTPAQRIATKLGEFGVPPGQARCMGERLQARLSLGQLQRLDAVVRTNRDRIGRMTINDIARALDDPRDPGLVTEVLRVGLGCLI